MVNHPNRSRKGGFGSNPTPEQIKTLREQHGLTQAEAAALIYSTTRTWQDQELGVARMHPGMWLLFRAKLRIPNLEDLVGPP